MSATRVVAAIIVKGGSRCIVRARTLADNDVEHPGLHRRVEHLLNHFIQAVNLIDKKHIAGRKVGQNRSQIADFFDGGIGCGLHLTAHFVRDKMCQRRFFRARGRKTLCSEWWTFLCRLKKIFKFCLMVSCPIYSSNLLGRSALSKKKNPYCFQWYLQGLLQILQKVFGNT